VIVVLPHIVRLAIESTGTHGKRFGIDAQGRRYRMGDLGRLTSKCLWALGRKDGQVKIR